MLVPMPESGAVQWPTYHSNVGLKHRHVDVGLKVRALGYEFGDAAELGEVAHHSKRVKRVDEGSVKAAPGVKVVAAERALYAWWNIARVSSLSWRMSFFSYLRPLASDAHLRTITQHANWWYQHFSLLPDARSCLLLCIVFISLQNSVALHHTDAPF